jgi:CRP-like cAMP-binding protein
MLATELLIRYPFFDFLTLDRLRAIAGISKEETYTSGTLIFREKQRAEGLYILVKGNVDLFFTVDVEYRPELHKELLFGIINPGEFFGISALIEPHILTSSARASSLSQVIKIDAKALLALCDQDEQLAYGLIHQVAKASIERLNATRIQLAAAWSSARVEK